MILIAEDPETLKRTMDRVNVGCKRYKDKQRKNTGHEDWM